MRTSRSRGEAAAELQKQPSPAPNGNEDNDKHVTYRPPFFLMFSIVLVQMINAADWSVILPIDLDIANKVTSNNPFSYSGLLIAALYFPFPLSLMVFRAIESYKWGYCFWATTCVIGNLMYILFIIYRPDGVPMWLIVARVVQGLAQCVTFSNKQVLALTTSYDVRNSYQSMLASGNIFGNALGVMICACYVKFMGTGITWANNTPAYLVTGALTLVLVAAVGGVLMTIFHPHTIEVVPEKYRVKRGKAQLVPWTALAGLDVDDTRRLRIVATLFLGFSRVTARSAWQTVTISLLYTNMGLSIWSGSIAFTGVTLAGIFAQQSFSYVHYLRSDEWWVRATEFVAFIGNIVMFKFNGLGSTALAATYLIGSTLLYIGLSINSNVTSVNATKFAIEGDIFFCQKSISTGQLIAQNMLGKIAGPLVGSWLYYEYGQDGFCAGILVINLMSTLCAEILMPPSVSEGAASSASPEGDAEGRPLLSQGGSV